MPKPGTSRVPAPKPAAIAYIPEGQEIALSGHWTAFGLGSLPEQIATLQCASVDQVTIDAQRVEAFDTVGAWVLQQLYNRLQGEGITPRMRGWPPQFAKLLELAEQPRPKPVPPPSRRGRLERVGRSAAEAWEQGYALLSFVGSCTLALATAVRHPQRLRWRPILHNIQSSGFSALPIVGLLSFLLGIVVAYQGAEQLQRYGANIFVADLIGLSMLREFAPLMTAIIVAGRSGSAYAAQIGTMAVTEEIDAIRTIGIPPLDLLVLPKILALLVVLPLLTVYADILGVLGGMIMARSQLGVGFAEFLERFVNAVDLSSYLIGVGKAPVFAAIIAGIGCFQGLRTQGGADSVGRQTTRSVVQAIFLVIVADALFSVVFSALDL